MSPTELAELTDEVFEAALVEAAFSRDHASFLHPDVVERTAATLKALTIRTTDAARRAREAGDDRKHSGNVGFVAVLRRLAAVVEPALKEARRASHGARPPGGTNWRRFAMTMLPLLERAVEGDLVKDRGLHDEMVEVLDQWDSRAFAYKDGTNQAHQSGGVS